MDIMSQTYVDNLTAASRLVKPELEQGMTEEQAVQEIRENAEKLFRIHQENDRILDEILFSRKAETLTEEEAMQLSELADVLFDYNRSRDVGIAYRIHKLLYEYAQLQNDTDLIVRELYYQGITLFYLNLKDPAQGIDLFGEQMGECFLAGASYLNRYEELTSSKTRSFILRCLGNAKYSLKESQSQSSWKDYMKCYNRAMEVFESPYYQQMNPELPWNNFIYTMHYDRTKFLSSLRDHSNREDGSYDIIAQAVMESAEYVYRRQKEIANAKARGMGIRTQYVYAAAKYHAGRIPVEELLEKLFEIIESADIHDFSSDNIWAILYSPNYLMRYLEDLPEERREVFQSRLQRAFDKQKAYLFLIPREEYGVQVSQTVHNIVGFLSAKDTRFSYQILDYVLACHPPTFVHSRVVALLTRRLCGQLIETNPEALVGTFGFETVEEIEGNREKILELAYQGGLYHDMGKCMLLSNVSLYTRKLLDEEFAGIKLHTSYGYRLLESLHMEDMAWIAYYHHRTYDGFGGYPGMQQPCPVRVSRIVDIVTVVDSLDAGTDNVGRSYAAAKTYEKLIEEVRSWRGKRYAPEIAALFDDPDFYDETKRFLKDKRRQVYLEIYCDKKEA